MPPFITERGHGGKVVTLLELTKHINENKDRNSYAVTMQDMVDEFNLSHILANANLVLHFFSFISKLILFMRLHSNNEIYNTVYYNTKKLVD